MDHQENAEVSRPGMAILLAWIIYVLSSVGTAGLLMLIGNYFGFRGTL